MERQVVAVGPRGKKVAIGAKAEAGAAPAAHEIAAALGGKNLACWCAAAPCHVDVLLEIANCPVCEAA